MSNLKRLYCTGEGSSFRYAMAANKAEATAVLHAPARLPDSDDIRRVWMENKLHEKTTAEIQALFGITRQALSIWRQKAGADVPRYRDHTAQQNRDRVRAALDASKSANELAQELGVSASVVREVAEQEGMVLPKKNVKKPSDEEIIRLSEGKTWRELAKLCNISYVTLQHYVYANPKLAEALRARMTYEKSGATAHGRVDVDKLVSLYEQGWTPYRIAQEFEVQNMTIIYWLKKLGIYGATA